MNTARRTSREGAMLALLLVLLLGIGYYLGFYNPLQQELAALSASSADLDTQILSAAAQVAEMDAMEAELAQILSQPPGDLTEIAPFDNKEAVLDQLHGILRQTQSYTLKFADPDVQPDGTVRRNISMHFRCADYTSAKAVIHDLNSSYWRCLVTNLSLVGETGNLLEGSVSVTAIITFFEHTGL